MLNQTVVRKHAALVDRMSDRLGVDLEESAFRGEISPELIPDLVLRCTNCANPEACTRLLDSMEQLEAAPSYCVNRDTLANLR
ncbi:hypothetical protein Dshi_2622 [Dinoroseobacter shibae DFL 12 = DSM 16493]|jgi:hypothetical protein|uniref:DUF6455 domain-containing protein n=1 Tax=Dinoroseobacter shibae (strain DSM 16493 / NCIMB 14021 / DFL 12) TaxID=398580 RepID=A8LI21_DINSH|nr:MULTISPECIES: DUF6455 family protein [Dinoroseobacter]ABV94355.1 hypothetical protein Dshi_2622 [Dinoroseobacter shibae DFL 12 = DSM 16493]MDD9717681.1 DUF6455 family protein [Dinoroseobacter sp. PD6]URF45786.1 DUF6455 family protein [Dinoroseobacter shibae]URF50092.1 DUF6455 family protein [Dinoroseobacter shibae]